MNNRSNIAYIKNIERTLTHPFLLKGRQTADVLLYGFDSSVSSHGAAVFLQEKRHHQQAMPSPLSAPSVSLSFPIAIHR